MNNIDFNFDKVGKNMPYKVPQGFFENAFEDTLKLAKKGQKTIYSRIVKFSVSIAAAVVLLIAGIYALNTNSTGGKSMNAGLIADSTTIPNYFQAGTGNDEDVSIDDIIKELSDEELEMIVNNSKIDMMNMVYADLF